MKIPLISLFWFICGSFLTFAAPSLTESIFTEIIKEANVVTSSDKTATPARKNDLFRLPDLVRTGRDSRVEMTAKDQTITRIGANTTFTFAQNSRDILLKKGGVLFHSPAGAGGGAIKYNGSSAAVLGTTVIGQALPDGRFKVLTLEGEVEVTLANGVKTKLKPGQMVIVSADGTVLSDVTDFNIAELVSHLLLVVGFSEPLSSRALIMEAIKQQNAEIASGSLTISTPWQEAIQGLDVVFGPLNDSSVYLNNRDQWWNPLDFPGNGGPGIMPQFPVISPLPITDTNPQGS